MDGNVTLDGSVTETTKDLAAIEAWRAVLGQLELQLPKPTFDTWLRQTEGVQYDDTRFVVEVPTPFKIAWLERRMYQPIQRTVTDVTGRQLEIQFQVKSTGVSACNQQLGNFSALPRDIGSIVVSSRSTEKVDRENISSRLSRASWKTKLRGTGSPIYWAFPRPVRQWVFHKNNLTAKEAWSVVLGEMARQLPKATFDTWLKQTEGVQYDDARFVVEVLTPFKIAWLERRMYQPIQRTLERVTGRVLDIQFQVKKEGVGEKEDSTDEVATSSREFKIAVASSYVYKVLASLLPQWLFDCFDESLLDDLFNFAKEEGGKIWWLKLSIVAAQFVIKFAWRRFGRRKATKRSSSTPNDRADRI